MQTQCKDDPRISCIRSPDCQYLLPNGQEVTFTWVKTSRAHERSAVQANASHPMRACTSCLIDGCLECAGGINGEIICTKCGKNFESDGQGGCIWNASGFDIAVYIFLGIVVVIAIWVLSDLIRAECTPIKNWGPFRRGLVMRRRAQLFKPESTPGASSNRISHMRSEKLQRYPLSTNLHSRESSRIMGPGLTLFMNWFIFEGCLSVWLCVGAVLFSSQENDLDPCRQQHRIKSGWEYRIDNPLPDDSDGRALKWALWNYLGALVLTVIFLCWQQHLWYETVQDSRHPSLREYTVMLYGVPVHETHKHIIEEKLGDWMKKLRLDPDGIQSVSVAYDIPRDQVHSVMELANRLLHRVAKTHSSSNMVATPSDATVGTAGGTDSAESGRSSTSWFFWVQFLGAIFFQTSFWGGGVGPTTARICPTDNNRQVKEMLSSLRGSGYVFVVLKTEALARAVAGMGRVQLEGISSKIRVCKSPAEPQMICWKNYGRIPTWERAFRLVRMVLVIFITLMLWLAIFGGFLSFELATKGYGGLSQGIAGFFVGMMVPIGNSLFGLIIDLLLNNAGFKDQDNLQLWCQILNVFVNGMANMGEIYLVFKKTYQAEFEFRPEQFLSNMQEVFRPLGVNPSAVAFQGELKAILFPAGMLVPIFTIPLLVDTAPWLIGRLRVKGDPSLSAATAERILKPSDVDFVGPYTDFIINLFLLSFASWISPGPYLVTLWITMCIWLLLLYLNMRMNVLRWQAVTFFGGYQAHQCASFLLALPLGMFCAALDHKVSPECHSGLLGLFVHVLFHIVFVEYVLSSLEPPRASFGTTLEEMMAHEHAPVADYLNTNPVEVLRRHYTPELEPDPTPLVFFRNDKWYLQKKPNGGSRKFVGEESIAPWSLRATAGKVFGKQSPRSPCGSEGDETPDHAGINPFSPRGPYDPLAGAHALTARFDQLSKQRRTSTNSTNSQ